MVNDLSYTKGSFLLINGYFQFRNTAKLDCGKDLRVGRALVVSDCFPVQSL